jgi:hypothetical protein
MWKCFFPSASQLNDRVFNVIFKTPQTSINYIVYGTEINCRCCSHINIHLNCISDPMSALLRIVGIND